MNFIPVFATLSLLTLGALQGAESPVLPTEQRLLLSLEEVADRKENIRYWQLSVKAPEKCACNRCTFENNLDRRGNEFTLTIGKIVPPLDCLEPSLPAEVSVKLPIEEREYFLTVNGERYRLQVTQDFAELRPLKTKLTRSQRKFFYRPIRNLVSVLCFRYQYACEKGKRTPDELCPRLFAKMDQMAKPADVKLLVKRDLTLDCTPEYRKKNQCRLYYFDGTLEQLKGLVDSSDSFKLPKGHRSQCEPGEPPLYYRRIKTWDAQEVCC